MSNVYGSVHVGTKNPDHCLEVAIVERLVVSGGSQVFETWGP